MADTKAMTNKTWRSWTDAETAQLREQFGSKNVFEMAVEMNRTPQAVRARATALRLTRPMAEREVCPHGHPYTDENTELTSKGHRRCATCRRFSRSLARIQFGMTVEEVEAQLLAQGNCCALCDTEFSIEDRARRPVFDHDHETGAARGFICEDCNLGLGRFKDNPDVLERAATWIRRAREEQHG